MKEEKTQCIIKDIAKQHAQHYNAFLLLPASWQGGKNKDKEHIANSIRELFESLDKLKQKLSHGEIMVRIELQQLKLFPFKKFVKPLIQGLKEGLSKISAQVELCVSDEMDAEDFTTTLEDIIQADDKMGKCLGKYSLLYHNNYFACFFFQKYYFILFVFKFIHLECNCL